MMLKYDSSLHFTLACSRLLDARLWGDQAATLSFWNRKNCRLSRGKKFVEVVSQQSWRPTRLEFGQEPPLSCEVEFPESSLGPWDHLTHLSLLGRVSYSLSRLPAGLKVLIIDSDRDFHQPLDSLPPSLTHLTFKGGGLITQPLNQLPTTLVSLTIKACLGFGITLDSLPSGLTHLTFFASETFSAPLDALPSTLCVLEIHGDLDNWYHQSHESHEGPRTHHLDQLPAELEKLILYCSFEGPLDHLPSKKLGFLKIEPPEWCYSRPLTRLPASLLELHLATTEYVGDLDRQTPQLTKLLLQGAPNDPLDHLPASLTHLRLLHFDDTLKRVPWPVGGRLTHLSLQHSFPSSEFLDHLPVHLIYLNLEFSSSNHKLDNLPPTLQFLRVGRDFNQLLHALPRDLIHLDLGPKFDQPLNQVTLPSNLQYLRVSRNYRHAVDHLTSRILLEKK